MQVTGSYLQRIGASLLFGLGLFATCSPCAYAQVDVLTQHNDNARSGVNLQETLLTPANVNSAQFGMLFKRVVDDQLYTQPLLVTGVTAGGGTRDLVYVTTVNNSVYAFDANDAEASSPVWHVNFGTPANLHSADFGCLDINGQMGIIGTPVIDKVRGVLNVVALTKAGALSGPLTGFTQRLHALDLATGADLPESPVVISAPDFNALMQNQRPALMLANGMVYVGDASHCDKEPYHGFLHKNLTLTWNPVSGARVYRVLRTSTLEPEAKTIGLGLTTATFTEPAPERGESVSYMVLAVGTDGASGMSEAVTVTSPAPKRMED